MRVSETDMMSFPQEDGTYAQGDDLMARKVSGTSSTDGPFEAAQSQAANDAPAPPSDGSSWIHGVASAVGVMQVMQNLTERWHGTPEPTAVAAPAPAPQRPITQAARRASRLLARSTRQEDAVAAGSAAPAATQSSAIDAATEQRSESWIVGVASAVGLASAVQAQAHAERRLLLAA